MKRAERLTVVVPTRDRPDLLARCLDALRDNLDPDDELIVVDSASRDASAPQIAAGHAARYLRAERPGASRARNAGWRAAQNRLIGFVDDDVVVGKGWGTAAHAAFAGDRPLAFVTGRVLPLPGQENVEHPVALYDHPNPFPHVRGNPRPYGISGNLLATREALERVGGFDELLGPGARFRGGGDDYDLFDRLLSSGADGRYDPTLLAYHDQWRARRERLKVDLGYGIGSGARLSKAMRLDRALARAIAKEIFWRWGLRDLGVCVRNGYKYGTVAALYRLAGMTRGLIAGLTVPVANGHFAPRSRD